MSVQQFTHVSKSFYFSWLSLRICMRRPVKPSTCHLFQFCHPWLFQLPQESLPRQEPLRPSMGFRLKSPDSYPVLSLRVGTWIGAKYGRMRMTTIWYDSLGSHSTMLFSFWGKGLLLFNILYFMAHYSKLSFFPYCSMCLWLFCIFSSLHCALCSHSHSDAWVLGIIYILLLFDYKIELKCGNVPDLNRVFKNPSLVCSDIYITIYELRASGVLVSCK